MDESSQLLPLQGRHILITATMRSNSSREEYSITISPPPSTRTGLDVTELSLLPAKGNVFSLDIPFYRTRLANRRECFPMKNRFTASRTGQTDVLWCAFRDQKGNSG